MSVAPAPAPLNAPPRTIPLGTEPANIPDDAEADAQNGGIRRSASLRDSRAVQKVPSIRSSKVASRVLVEATGLKAKLKSFLAFLIDVFMFQSFLDLHQHDEDPKGLKASLQDTNSNLALVNALLLSMVFPMGMSPDDWTAEGRSGWVAQTFGLEFIFDEEWQGLWYDQSIMGFRMGLGALLMAVVASTFQLLAISEIQDDNHAQVYLRTVSKAALKFPFRAMLIGVLAPFLFSVALRHTLTFQTLLGVVGLNITVGPILGYMLFAIYHYIKAVYVAVEEKDKFERITISEKVIIALVEEYFALKPEYFDIDDFLHEICDITDLGYAVPLAYCTRMLARKHFYIHAGKRLGLELTPEMLAKLCYEREESSSSG